MPTSWDIAGMWRQVFVEPPSVISINIALSNASRVIIFLLLIPFLTSSTTLSPLLYAILSFSAEIARDAAHPGNDMPSASVTQAIVFAVYNP